MSYDLFMNGVQYPVTPSKIQLKIGNNNKTITLINEGEANVLKSHGLKEISFDLLLPAVNYPFATYADGFKSVSYYVGLLQGLKENATIFQFILSRNMPRGTNLYNTNLTVSLEDVTFKDDKKEGFDTVANVKLKEWRKYGTKRIAISVASGVASVTEERPAGSSEPTTAGRTYTVVRGDCLWKIAKQFYGNGAEYTKISEANSSISNPNLIFPGQTLVIP